MSATAEAEPLEEQRPVASRDLLERAQLGRSVAPVATVARRAAIALASRGRPPAIEVVEDRGRYRLSEDPLVEVHVRDPRTYAAVLRRGSVGLGASYVAGWWESDDLTALMQELFARSSGVRTRLDSIANAAVVRIARDVVARRTTPRRPHDRRNVRAHYDLSNEFFGLVLDDTMTYSCALFADDDTDLAAAQRTRIDRSCRKLDLQPDEHLLEIGSGWGQLALHAAMQYGCRVTTTTISEEQRRHVLRRVREAGLSDRVTVLGDDWRDLTGTFDKLVSIEMIEAVDWRHHNRFFASCAERLTDSGVALIQAIVIDDRSFERAKHRRDLIKSLVFPGSCIPSVASITASLARATDLRVIDLEDIGRHYAETLRRWSLNLRAHDAQCEALGVEAEVRRLFRIYFAYCEAAFLERHISDVQLLLARPAWRGRLAVRPP